MGKMRGAGNAENCLMLGDPHADTPRGAAERKPRSCTVRELTSIA